MALSSITHQALQQLMENADNRDCCDWLHQNLGLGDDVLKFDESDLDDQPTYPSPNNYLTYLTKGKNFTGVLNKWAPFIVNNSCEVPMTYLALFLHTAGVSKTANLAPCQPPINGKRFSEFPRKAYSKLDKNTPVGAMLLPYKLTVAHPENPRVLPMVYEDAVARSEQPLATFATASVTKEDVLQVFEILFGSRPPKEDGKSWEDLYKMGGPSTLFSLLLLYMSDTYDLQEVASCKRLLVALGRHVFGAETCIARLNQLGISNDYGLLHATITAIFSSVIPLKLGCLTAESFLVGAHRSLVLKKMNPGYDKQATTNILLPSPTTSDVLPCNHLKKMSNKLNHNARQWFTTGSLDDFCRDVLLEYRSKGNKLMESNEDYIKDQDDRAREALEKIIQGSKHNPHLKGVIDSYKLKMACQGLEETDLEAQILKKFKKTTGSGNAFAPDYKKGPASILVLVMILTDFHDEANAKALSRFACTTNGVGSNTVFCFHQWAAPYLTPFTHLVAHKRDPSFHLDWLRARI